MVIRLHDARRLWPKHADDTDIFWVTGTSHVAILKLRLLSQLKTAGIAVARYEFLCKLTGRQRSEGLWQDTKTRRE